MYKKYLNYTNILITGILMIITGIFIIVLNSSFLIVITYLLSAIFMIKAISNIIGMLNRTGNYNSTNIIIQILLSIVLSVVSLYIPKIPLSIFSIIFGGYILFNSLARLINYLILRKNKEKGRIIELIIFLIYFAFGASCVIMPLIQINIILTCISIYLIVVGTTYILSFIGQIIPNKIVTKIENVLKIPMPIFLSVLLPHSISKNIDKKETTKGNVKSDFDILIHVTKKGTLLYGHIDLYFNKKIYSFGNYDHDTLKFHEAIGDGVLFILNNKKQYIDFCIEDTKRTIFDFGIRLTDNEKLTLQKNIDKLLEHTYEWDEPVKMAQEVREKYFFATRLYKKTNAKFYKFKKGKFKTFFIGTHNCAKLIDYLLKGTNIRVIHNNGIITPGIYYDYLATEYSKKNSQVISYKIYK